MPMPFGDVVIQESVDDAVRVHEYLEKFEKYGVNVEVHEDKAQGIRIVELSKANNSKFVTRMEVIPPDTLDNVLAHLYEEL